MQCVVDLPNGLSGMEMIYGYCFRLQIRTLSLTFTDAGYLN